MPAGLASLVMQAQAFFTVLLAVLLFGEPIQRHNVIGMTVATVGLVLIGIGGASGSMTTIGFVLTLCAAMSWASGNLVTKRIGAVDPLGLVIWGALIPPLPFLGLSLWLDGPEKIVASLSGFDGMSLFAVVYLAFAATCFGYMVWGRLLTQHPVRQVAPLALLVPVVGLISTQVFLDEHLTAVQWFGALVVMGGLILNVFGMQIRTAILARLK